jgi:hypothetical protein
LNGTTKLSRACLIALALAAVLVSTSCASQEALARAKELQAAGDWAGAALAVIESLKYDQNNADAAKYALFVIPQALQAQLERIAAARASDSETMWEEIVRAYEAIHAINDAWLGLPQVLNPDTKQPISFELVYYREELAQAKQNAAGDLYARGIEFMSRGGVANYREAYRFFMRALQYVPDYKDARTLAEEVRIKGSDSIVIMPFAEGRSVLWGLDVSNKLTSWTGASVAAVAKTRTFLRVVDSGSFLAALSGATGSAAWAEAGARVGATHVVSGQVEVSDWVAPNVNVRYETARREIDVPVWVSTVPPSSSQAAGAPFVVYQSTGVAVTLYPVYGAAITSSTRYLFTHDFAMANGSTMRFYAVSGDPTTVAGLGANGAAVLGYVYLKEQVEARLTWYTKSERLTVSASFQVVDIRTGEQLYSGAYSEKAEDSCEWLVWSGDERALSSSQRDAANARERTLESERSLAERALRIIADKIGAAIGKLFP